MKTVSAKWLKAEAARVDRHAEQSLQAWIILGETAKYSQHKELARALNRAVEIQNIAERREYLRQHGIEA